MFIIVKAVNLSVFIALHSHVRCLLIAEKLLSHSQDVTRSVQMIFRRTKIFGKWSSSHSFDRCCQCRSTLRFWNILPLFHSQSNFLVNDGWVIKYALYISMTGASFATISDSLHINSGIMYRSLDAVIENLLKRNFISKIKVSNIGIAMTRLYYLLGFAASILSRCICL